MTKVLTPVAFVALFALSAAPALAQRRGDGGRSAGRSRGSESRAPSRSYGGYRGEVRGGHSYYAYARPYESRRYYPRPFYSFRPRVNLGFGIWMGYPVPYSDYYDPSLYRDVYPGNDPYGYAQPYGGSGYPAYGGSGYPAYGGSGYPAYGGSGYPANGGSGYPAYGGSGYPAQQGSPRVGVQRGAEQSTEGGVSFEITPANAEVFVDGSFVGTAGDFDPRSEPLGLSNGRHRVEVRASGYRTMTLDADVRAGEVIPFRGTLQRN